MLFIAIEGALNPRRVKWIEMKKKKYKEKKLQETSYYIWRTQIPRTLCNGPLKKKIQLFMSLLCFAKLKFSNHP